MYNKKVGWESSQVKAHCHNENHDHFTVQTFTYSKSMALYKKKNIYYERKKNETNE